MELLGVGRPDGYVDRKARIFDWQFSRNPHDDGRSPFLIGEIAAGTIAALNGFMPARIRFQGRRMLGCWSCDTYVSPSCRGRGYGKELLKRVSEAAPVMLGYGISDMSDPIFHKLGWLPHERLQLMFFHVAEPGVSGMLKNGASRAAALRGVHRNDRSYDVTHHIDDRLGSEIDDLWTRSAHGYFSALERDAAYLRWKYFEHPVHEYLCYSVRSRGVLDGLMIARWDPVESVLVDYCGPADERALMSELGAAVVRDLAARRTARIRTETTHAPLAEALRRVGFIGSRHASRFRVRSNVPASDPLRGWFVMPGDSDGDVLSMGEPGAPALGSAGRPGEHA